MSFCVIPANRWLPVSEDVQRLLVIEAGFVAVTPMPGDGPDLFQCVPFIVPVPGFATDKQPLFNLASAST